MASKKKEIEAIALLSMYGIEDDDMEADTDSDDGSNNQNDDNAVPTVSKEQNEIGANETENMEENHSETLNNSNIMGYIHGGSIRPVINLDSVNDNSTQLPPPLPTRKCSDELQELIIKFLSVKKKTGRGFNSEMRNRKDYRNPEFLTHAVTYHNIDEIGCCFSKEVDIFYEKSEYYDATEADLKGEVSTAIDTVTREGRVNKKSKWIRQMWPEDVLLPPVDRNPNTSFGKKDRREAEGKIIGN